MNLYNEFDANAAQWLERLIKRGSIPQGRVDHRSIVEIDSDDLSGVTQFHGFCGIGGWPLALKIAGWPESSPIWSASLPCQPWSNCGKRLGHGDERHLAPIFLSLVSKRHPPIIFGEQVASKAALEWLDGLFDELENQGYTCGAADLCACSIGATHIRQRLFWSAYSSSFRAPRLEPSRDFEALGSWWQGSPEDLQHVVKSPFEPGPRWPQSLLRSQDDGLSSRVVGCHAAGNAIMPALAAQFITATIETFNA